MDRLRRRLQTAALLLVGLGVALGVLALEHMRALAAYGYVCGGAVAHCPACAGSLAALALGAAAVALAARAPREARIGFLR